MVVKWSTWLKFKSKPIDVETQYQSSTLYLLFAFVLHISCIRLHSEMAANVNVVSPRAFLIHEMLYECSSRGHGFV